MIIANGIDGPLQDFGHGLLVDHTSDVPRAGVDPAAMVEVINDAQAEREPRAPS